MAIEILETKTPQSAIDRLMDPIRRFIAIESASGVLLLLCAVVALVLANSLWSESFAAFWHTHFRIGLGKFEIDESLLHWVNDGLMTIFFFVVGLEIKREIVDGELNAPRKAALPLMAALGGMIAPAMLYLALIGGAENAKAGWGIPMATDIAFVVGFLALLGSRVPPSLKILLLAVAIVDDIGAILVIALFYSNGTSLPALALAVTGLGLTVLSRWLGIRNIGVYALIGLVIWLAMFHSGIHPTVAGVLLGLLTPAKPFVPRVTVVQALTTSIGIAVESDAASMGQLKSIVTESVSPLERLEAALHPWVAFLIMPLFALANAGVQVDFGAITHSVAWSVALGLIVGKPVGIFLFSWLAVKVGIATLPEGVSWKIIIGAGALAGIGFTMSLFITNLAFSNELINAGKVGTILGSIVSAILGLSLLVIFLPDRGPETRT